MKPDQSCKCEDFQKQQQQQKATTIHLEYCNTTPVLRGSRKQNAGIKSRFNHVHICGKPSKRC